MTNIVINENIGAVILKTIDGGDTWQVVFNSNDGMEYIWKMDFVNGDVAYGSVESFANSTTIGKTTNGGDSWEELVVSSIALDIQGIGFANELKGNANEALNIYERIQKEYPKSTEAQDIDKYIAKVKASGNL